MLKKIIAVLSMVAKKGILYLFICFFPFILVTRANDLLLDKVIATVDQELIMHSELEEVCNQLALEGKIVDDSVKAKLLSELILNKIFLAKAVVDNIKIPQKHIQRECDMTITAGIQHVGSEAELATYFHQPIHKVKERLKEALREKYLVLLAKESLTGNVVVTPAEVKAYFDALSPGKYPYYPTSFEVYQLVVYPKIALERREAAKNKLLYLKRLLMTSTATFSELAQAHSDDPASLSKGGEIGWVPLGVLAPAYESAALSLKVGQISDPIVSDFGLHIIELLGRNQDRYNTRHILFALQPTQEEIAFAEIELNKIRASIIDGSCTIESAIKQYSEDKESVAQGGLISANKQVGGGMPSALLSADVLDPEVYFVVDRLAEGDISRPQFMGGAHKSGWRLFYLKQKVAAHAINLTQDYEKICYQLLQQKREEVFRKWVQTAKSAFVIQFAPEYAAVEALL